MRVTTYLLWNRQILWAEFVLVWRTYIFYSAKFSEILIAIDERCRLQIHEHTLMNNLKKNQKPALVWFNFKGLILCPFSELHFHSFCGLWWSSLALLITVPKIYIPPENSISSSLFTTFHNNTCYNLLCWTFHVFWSGRQQQKVHSQVGQGHYPGWGTFCDITKG